MSSDYFQTILAVVKNVLVTMTSVSLEIGEPQKRNTMITYGEVTGLIGMGGDNVTGNMTLSFDKPAILGIVSRMLSEQFAVVNKDVIDAVGELTNIIAGGAKRELAEKGYFINMASPSMISGKGIELAQKSNAPIWSVIIKTPEGSFALEANLSTNETASVDNNQTQSHIKV